MKNRSPILTALALTSGSLPVALALLAACAHQNDEAGPQPDASQIIVLDGASAEAAAEAGFGAALPLDPCLPGTLCPDGLFDPQNPSNGLDVRTRIELIRGRAPDDVWAAGARGAVAHFDGTSWTRTPTGNLESVNTMWLRDQGEIAVVSLSSFYTRDMALSDGGAGGPSDGGWTSIGAPPGPDIVASSSGLVSSSWTAVGAEWLWLTTVEFGSDPGTYPPANGLWRAHLAGAKKTLTLDSPFPDSACATYGCRQLSSIHGSSADDLWAVGYGGTAVHITNAQSANPSVMPYDSQTWAGLNGVWAAGPADVWAVGGAGTIRHYSGQPTSLDIVTGVPATETLRAVWGSSSTDIWAVGDALTVLHYDGKTWSRVKVTGVGPRMSNLYSVWVPEAGHVWAAGDGVILSLGGKP